MSYCRFGSDKSDLYIIHSIYGFLECMCCELANKHSFTTLNRTKMIEHIEQHRRRGDRVAQHAIDRLQKEIREVGDFVS